MKRKVFSVLSLVCVLTLLFSLCSCSSSISGKYRLKMIYENGVLYELGNTYQDINLSEDTFSLTINNDNTLLLKATTKGSSFETKGVWCKTGDNEYRGFIAGDQMYITVDGNTVIVCSGKDVIIFKK